MICRLAIACLILLTSQPTLSGEGVTHWALRPVEKPPLPEVDNKAWIKNPVDLFVLARLEEADLEPSPPASTGDLQRRLFDDLIGLLPGPDDEFASPEITIHKLMATPQYGERWARHWLDVVRYADSNGLDENAAHANAWRYRDYVVQSFNSDKPYDQFLLEQIAGDLLPATDQAQTHTNLIATGFLALGPKVLAEPDKTKMEMDIIDEQIDTLGRALLGMTLGCARCHDHKFDPVPTDEYYALAGIFKSTRTMDSLETTARWHENSLSTPEEHKLKENHDQLLAAQQKVIAAFIEKANQQLLVEHKLKQLPPKPEEQYSKATREELARLQNTLERLQADAPVLPFAMGVTDGDATNLPVFLRGNHETPGALQQRRFPRALGTGQVDPIGDDVSGRLELAQWIASQDNPLTARVMVNRVWRWHFGRGLVATTDNFGKLGAKPTHPELLDWLAGWFVENGWSVKKLNRLILNSATYQMSSQASPEAIERDPNNQLFSRAPLRRIEAEPLRDALLQISNLLDLKMGGYVWTFPNFKLVFDHTSEDATTYASNRRSIYLPVIRNHVYSLFELFDFPDPSTVTGHRTSSTVAPQGLFLMNSPFVLRTTEALATRLLNEEPVDSGQRLTRLYALVYHRRPSAQESKNGITFVKQFAEMDNDRDSNKGPLASWQALCQVLISSNEFLYLR
ncbi:MAG: DUF1549 and DUF1553 domain-containing protein [Pirellulales bacterium]|nr:DUF1549 and DUF1553 domain-containing protein [Pirellulales bacterium]